MFYSDTCKMYMNYTDFADYRRCENTYWGYMHHYDTLTNITMTNQDTPIESISISILASFLEADTKWGLFKGISSRPLMPIAVKMLFSKTRLREDDALIRQQKVSKEDIRLLKLYNMLSVTWAAVYCELLLSLTHFFAPVNLEELSYPWTILKSTKKQFMFLRAFSVWLQFLFVVRTRGRDNDALWCDKQCALCRTRLFKRG